MNNNDDLKTLSKDEKKDFKNSTLPFFDAFELNTMCEKLLKYKLNNNIIM